ncbi:TPA: prohibitin family protein [Candidatus Bathyarchaeota archaeon]|nr:prohibitin family protein [Candidatus Bathyarchaeota archaeon]
MGEYEGVPIRVERVVRRPLRWVRMVAAVVIVAGIGMVLLGLSVGSVGTGEASVIIDPITGKIGGPVLGPRWFLKAPWQTYVNAYVATDKVHMWTDPTTGRIGDFPAIGSLTSDSLAVDVDVTIRWAVDPTKLVDLYRNYPGLDWKGRTIVPLVRGVVRDVIARYKAIDTITRREEIASAITEELAIRLGETRSLVDAISIESVDLRRIELPARFKDAIETKLREEQLMLAAEFNKTRIMIMANASAQARILEAQGEANATLVRASATAEAMRIIAQALGSNSTEETRLAEIYLSLSLLKEIAATGKNVYIIVPTEGVPIIIPLKETE